MKYKHLYGFVVLNVLVMTKEETNTILLLNIWADL